MSGTHRVTFGSWRGAVGLPALCLGVIVLALLQFVTRLALFKEPVLDDAFMFSRYAKHFRAGLGLAWNPDGVQTYGVTSLLHFGVVTLFQSLLPFSDEVLLASSSAVMGLTALGVVALTCSRIWPLDITHRGLFWLAIVTSVFLGNSIFVYHAGTGMDTMLAVACNAVVVLATIVHDEHRRARSLFWLLAAAYIATLARPDSIVYVALFPPLYLWCRGRKPVRAIITYLAALAMILGADAVAKWVLLGDILPLSFFAKQSGFYEGYLDQWNPVVYGFEFIGLVAVSLAIIALTVTRRTAPLALAFGVPVLIACAYYFQAVQIMGYHARFYMPAFPFVVVGSVVVLRDFVGNTGLSSERKWRMAVVRGLAVLAIASGLDIAGNVLGRAWWRYHRPVASVTARALSEHWSEYLPPISRQANIAAMTRFAMAAPAGTSLAASEYGIVGSSAPHVTIIDPIGLNDPEFAHHGFKASTLMRHHPDVIWLPHRFYTRMVTEILDNDELWRDYLVYPDAFNSGLAIRKDSPRFPVLFGLLERAWAEAYPARRMEDYLARRPQQ
jgi:hypothetical protein